MSMKKRAMSAALAGTVLCSAVVPAMAADVKDMTDVAKTDWHYQYVKSVMKKGYMVGTSATTFAPQTLMSRAMFATALASMDKADVTNKETKFGDVAVNAWYAGQVKWATDHKIVVGMSDTQFGSELPVTRQDMCVMMNAYINHYMTHSGKKVRTKEKEKTFADAAQIADYAKEAVKLCQMYGLIDGYPDGTFGAQRYSTRAEVAVVLKQLDTLLYGTGGGGGGGNGPVTPDPVVETKKYYVSVKADAPFDKETLELKSGNAVEVTITDGVADYDETFAEVLKRTVIGDNEQAIKNAVGKALEKILGEEVTRTVKGEQITVKVDEHGVVSASMSMKMTNIVGSKAQARAAVSDAEMEELIGRLQNGEEVSSADMTVLVALINKATDLVDNMTPEEVQKKVDAYVKENPQYEQVVKGMDGEAIQAAAATYKTELGEVKTDIEAVPAGTPVKPEKPVLLNIEVDLSAYYKLIEENFDDYKDLYLEKLQAALTKAGHGEMTEGQVTAAEAMYDLGDPNKTEYMTVEGKNLKIAVDPDFYLSLIQKGVNAGITFYEKLEEDREFFQALYNTVDEKYGDKAENAGMDYDVNTEVFEMLADGEGMFVDRLDNSFAEQEDTHRSTTNLVKVVETADESAYDYVLDLIEGKHNKVDQLIDLLPNNLPGRLLGEYSVTIDLIVE